MNRRVASRKLARNCDVCHCGFEKGDVYYRDRRVFIEFGEVVAFERRLCPKCKYKEEDHGKRFEKFKSHCDHPITDVIWTPIYPGEAAMEPDHEECIICGQYL